MPTKIKYKIVPSLMEYKGEPIAYNVMDSNGRKIAIFDGSRDYRKACKENKVFFEKCFNSAEALKFATLFLHALNELKK